MNIISVTDRAYEEMMKISSENEALGIRLMAIAGGCAGHTYDMTVCHEINEQDKLVKHKDLAIYIDRSSILKIFGAEIGYSDDPFSEGFVITNESKKGCGCGKSFS